LKKGRKEGRKEGRKQRRENVSLDRPRKIMKTLVKTAVLSRF
jgi:hypothetical protein